jgi:hypothetical protein
MKLRRRCWTGVLTAAAVSIFALSVGSASAATAAECPNGLACQVVPAAYQQNNPSDPSDYGNYDLAVRPTDGLGIRFVVIHDTEVGYDDTIRLFQNPLAYVSAHYVLRSADGQVT